MSDREKTLRRLGVMGCANCDAVCEPQARVQGSVTPYAPLAAHITRDCCSATCAVAVLSSMDSGIARIVNMKKLGVIARKNSGHSVGVWPRGRRRLAVEKRKAARQ